MNRLELTIPPLAVFAFVAICMMLIGRQFNATAFDFGGSVALASVFFFVGAFAGIAGVLQCRKVGTTVHPSRPEATSSIVSSGIFRYTRNPMYLGLLFVLLAWALYLGNWLALFGLIAFFCYISRFQIQPEERVLNQQFGESYRQYTEEVRRWL